MDTIRVTPATPAEEAACLAMLPDSRVPEVELLIARIGDRLAGAAAIGWLNVHDQFGFPVELHVLPEARRKGVGRALLHAAIGLAEGETDALWSRRPVAIGEADAAFLEACGFTIGERIFQYRIPTVSMGAHLARILDRMRGSGRVPAHARVIALRDAPLAEVARIVAAVLERSASEVLAMLHHVAGGIDLDRSVAVLEGDEVVGATLVRWEGGECKINANVVVPRLRNTYANAMLLAQVAQNIVEAGAQQCVFSAREHALDTINLSKRAGGDLISTRAYYRYALASA